MGTVANLSVRISASIKDFQKGLDQVESSWAAVGSKMTSVGASLTAAVTLPIVGIGVAATKAGLDFERVMNQITGVMRPTSDQMGELRQKALDMGAATVFSAGDAATAMLELGKAGFTTKQALEGVPQVLELAAASGLSMGDAAELSARTVAAFGLKISDLGHVNDVLAKAVNSSTLEITDLQTAFAYVGPIATGFGVSLEQVTASLAIMRDAGINAETSGRALREGLSRLANPTAPVTAVMGELGIKSFTDSNGALLGLSTIIGMLNEKGLTAAQSLKLFGDAAGPGMFALVTQGQAALDNFTLSLHNSGGSAGAMASAMMQGLPGAFEQLKGSVETAFIAISKALEPVLIPLINGLTQVVNFITTSVVPAFTALPLPVQTAIVAFLGILAAVGPLLVAFGTVATSVAGLLVIFPGLGTVLAAVGGTILALVTGPIGLIAAALAAATAVWVLFGDDITRIVSGIFTSAKTWLVDMWEGSIFQSIAQLLEAMAMLYYAVVGKVVGYFIEIHKAALMWLVEKFRPIADAILPVLATVWGVFQTAYTNITGFVMKIYEGVKMWLLDKITGVIDGLKAKIDAATGFFRDMYTKVVGQSYVPDMVAGIGTSFGQLDGLMVGKAQSATSMVTQAFQSMEQSVLSSINSLVTQLSSALTGWLDGFMPSWAAKLVGGVAGSVLQSGTNSLLGAVGLGKGGGLLAGLLGGGAANSSVAGVLAGNAGIAGVLGGGGGAAAGAGAAGGGGIMGSIGSLLTNPITAAVGGGIALALGIWKGGLFRGGEEALKVNPARDEFFQGFQNKFGGDQQAALATAFNNAGVSGDIANQLITQLYHADTMKEFEAATKAINDTLALGTVTATENSAQLTAASTASSAAVGGLTTALADFTNQAIASAAAWMPNDPSVGVPIVTDTIPGFAGGSNGFQNFGGGTLALLHGTEAVVRPEDMRGAAGPTVNITGGTIIGNSDEFRNAVADAYHLALEKGGQHFKKGRILNRQMAQAT